MTGRRERAGAAALLTARAADLARPLQHRRTGTSLELLLATLGDQRVALPAQALREVRPPTPLAPVPGTSEVLLGIAAGHAQALAVASLAALLGVASAAPSTVQWLLVLDDATAPVGLLVDSVDDVVSVDGQGLGPPPEGSALIAGLAPDGALVLDIPALLGDARLFLDARPEPTEADSWHHA